MSEPKTFVGRSLVTAAAQDEWTSWVDDVLDASYAAVAHPDAFDIEQVKTIEADWLLLHLDAVALSGTDLDWAAEKLKTYLPAFSKTYEDSLTWADFAEVGKSSGTYPVPAIDGTGLCGLASVTFEKGASVPTLVNVTNRYGQSLSLDVDMPWDLDPFVSRLVDSGCVIDNDLVKINQNLERVRSFSPSASTEDVESGFEMY